MTKNAWILVNRYCLTFNIYRPFLVDSSVLFDKKKIKCIKPLIYKGDLIKSLARTKGDREG